MNILYNQPMNVYSFQPLDAASLSELKGALNGFLRKGETIKLETKVECQFTTPPHIPMTILKLV